MKLSVCTDAVFSALPTEEAMETVKACGIDAIEFWHWESKDIDAIAVQAQRLSMDIAAFCVKELNLVEPACRVTYIAGLRETLLVARRLNCKCLIAQVGQDTGAPRERQRQSVIDGLKCCIPLLEEAGVTLAVEPLNTAVDHRGYYLSSSAEGGEIIEAVGSSHVRLLYDCYHQQIMEGDIIRSLTRLGDRIGHVHAAGNPGRHELDCGELRYEAIFGALDCMGYAGFTGLEYFPKDDPKAGLMKLSGALRRC